MLVVDMDCPQVFRNPYTLQDDVSCYELAGKHQTKLLAIRPELDAYMCVCSIDAIIFLSLLERRGKSVSQPWMRSNC